MQNCNIAAFVDDELDVLVNDMASSSEMLAMLQGCDLVVSAVAVDTSSGSDDTSVAIFSSSSSSSSVSCSPASSSAALSRAETEEEMEERDQEMVDAAGCCGPITLAALPSSVWSSSSHEPMSVAAAPVVARPVFVNPENVTTMTATFSVNQAVNLRRLAKHLVGGCVIYDPRSVALETARGATKRSFQNQACVELEVEPGRRLTASVFSNGTIKLTGCKSEEDCEWAASTMEDRIRRSRAGIVAMPSALERSVQLEIVMVKADFDLGFPICLPLSLPVLSSVGLEYTYEPDRYCAVKIHVPLAGRAKPVTVCLFHTGKTFVTGHISLEEVKRVYDIVSIPILAARDKIQNGDAKPAKKKPAPKKRGGGIGSAAAATAAATKGKAKGKLAAAVEEQEEDEVVVVDMVDTAPVVTHPAKKRSAPCSKPTARKATPASSSLVAPPLVVVGGIDKAGWSVAAMTGHQAAIDAVIAAASAACSSSSSSSTTAAAAAAAKDGSNKRARTTAATTTIITADAAPPLPVFEFDRLRNSSMMILASTRAA